MRSNHSEKRTYKKGLTTGIIIVFVFLTVFGAAFFVSFYYNAKETEIKGPVYGKRAEIREKLFKDEDDYSLFNLYYMCLKSPVLKGTSLVKVEPISFVSFRITITENPPFIQFKVGESYYMTDNEGVFLGSSIYGIEGLFSVEGYNPQYPGCYSDYKANDEFYVKKAIAYKKALTEAGLSVNTLFYDESGYYIETGDIRIVLGKEGYEREQIHKVSDMLPKYTGLKGILYLDTLTEDEIPDKFYFKVTK